MKKFGVILFVSLCCTAAHAELQALDSEELENELTVTNITAFQSQGVDTPSLELQNTSPGHNELRIQQEVNALRIAPIESGIIQSIELENQILQGPNSAVIVRENGLLNF